MISKQEKDFINGSGLFFFKTKISDERKLEILKWYRELPQFQRDYVDQLIQEAKDETDFFNQV